MRLLPASLSEFLTNSGLRRILSKLPSLWPIGTFIFIEITLLATNYSPGTFLMGWDNVMPEFDFRSNFTRSLFGVWQEHRGLGLYDGMSHIANLPHTLFLWLLSLVLPTNLLRYAFTFFMHFLGGLGAFFLLKYLLDKSMHMHHFVKVSNLLVPLVGALFYLFNLAAIQMFYAPLEAFSMHFAALPWLTLSLLNYLETGSPGKLALFFLTAFLTTPQYFVTTLVLPVSVMLALTSSFYLVKSFRLYLVRVLQATVGFALINAFWLLPYLAGLAQNAPVITGAKINQMSSGEIFARNQAFGAFQDVALLRGFSLEFDDLISGDAFGLMMAPWHSLVFSLPGTILAWSLALFSLIGAVASLRRSRSRFLPFLGTAAFGFLMLGSDIPILSQFTYWFYGRIPFFAEAYRLPFTKFSLLFALSYGIFIALGVEALSNLLAKFSRKTVLIPAVLVIGTIAYLSLPAWSGNFIYSNLRLKMPQEYLGLFNFLREQNHHERAMLLPQPAYWSWKFYRWGYRGSGFLWYGLQQPTLDRAFDPWSRESENYYWELSRALYGKDAAALDAVLRKYNIRYVLFDENLISPSHNRALFSDEAKELLTRIPKIKQLATFGKLTLYEQTGADTKSFISFKSNLPTVSPSYRWTDNDVAYQQLGDYTDQLANHNLQLATYFYPFRSLFTKRAVDEREFKIKETDQMIILADFNESTSAAIVKREATVYDSALTGHLNPQAVTRCGLFKDGSAGAELLLEGSHPSKGETLLRFTSRNQRACLSFGVPNLSHKDSYLVVVESRQVTGSPRFGASQAGRPLLFSLINQTAKHVELETYLPATTDWQTSYFILPPLASDGLGYGIYLANDAIGRYETINDIKSLKFYKLPYQELISLRMPESSLSSNNLTIEQFNNFSVSHPNPAYYKVNLQLTTDLLRRQVSNSQPITLVLSQSFHPGWVAFVRSQNFPHIRPLTEHVMVNNWANGWTLREPTTDNSQPTTIILFFYPQLWEFLGIALLPLPFLWLWIRRPPPSRR